MDRRVKERLVGASILVVLIVLIVPELLSGPTPGSPAPRPPVSAPEPVRTVTVELGSSNAPEPVSPPPPAAAPAPTPVPAPQSAGQLETRSPPPTSTANAARALPAARGDWAVQLGSFASRDNADKLVRQLKSQGFSVYVLSGGSGPSLRYRVRIGPMEDRGAAAQTALKLKSLGHIASLVPPAA